MDSLVNLDCKNLNHSKKECKARVHFCQSLLCWNFRKKGSRYCQYCRRANRLASWLEYFRRKGQK